MPRGGARPNSGGKRAGAGRKKGSATRKTSKTNRLAQEAAGEGVLPLQVMLEAMRELYANRDLQGAAKVAAQAAPYVHSRLSSTTVKGTVGVTLEVVEEIVDADGSASP